MRYFLSHYNRFYAFAVHQNIRRLYALTIIVLVGIFAGWYFGIHMLLCTKISHAKNRITVGAQQTATITKYHRLCTQIQDAINTLKKKIVYTKHSSKKQPIDCIMQAAQKNGITIKQCEIIPNKKKRHTQYQDIRCSMIGTYDQFIAFFDAIHAQKQPMQCKQLTMNAHNNTFETTCILRWYYMI